MSYYAASCANEASHIINLTSDVPDRGPEGEHRKLQPEKSNSGVKQYCLAKKRFISGINRRISANSLPVQASSKTNSRSNSGGQKEIDFIRKKEVNFLKQSAHKKTYSEASNDSVKFVCPSAESVCSRRITNMEHTTMSWIDRNISILNRKKAIQSSHANPRGSLCKRSTCFVNPHMASLSPSNLVIGYSMGVDLKRLSDLAKPCLLYTSDAADE